jgi:hypothetical protein
MATMLETIMKPLLKQGLLIACVCIASGRGSIAFADDAPRATEHQAAVWQQRQYSFAFLGFTSTYSCDGLADKLKILLLAAGARSDVKALSGGCPDGFGRPDKLARADLTFHVLVPVDAADAANADSANATAVDGIWSPVAFAAHAPRELGTGDCELVEQFKSSVLPLFTTRDVSDRITCIPHQLSGSVIDLKFESLRTPAPKPK